MHILLIHQAFVGKGEAGGTRHFEMARYCVSKGMQFTVVASTVSYLSGRRLEPETRIGEQSGREGEGERVRGGPRSHLHYAITALRFRLSHFTFRSQGRTSESYTDGIRVLRAPTPELLHLSFVARILAFVGFMVTSTWVALGAGKVDVVVGTTPPLFQALSAWVVAALRRRPFLLEVRDLWPEFAIDMGVLTNPLLIAVARLMERFLYARATHLLVNSPAYRDYLHRKGISAAKVSLIPNGVDPTMFEQSSATAAAAAQFRHNWGAEDKFVVTYAGALGLANDLMTLLRAAHRLSDQPQILFLLVGDGKERQHLQQAVHELRLDNVRFTGSIAKSDIPGILAASDACVALLQDIPMFRTTYPNKVFDYMAAARPTLLAIDGVIREVIEKAGGGLFVPPGDDDALATAVHWLYDHTDEAEAMGQRARAYVIEHFNRAQQAEAFAVLLEDLANGRRSNAGRGQGRTSHSHSVPHA